MNMSVAQLDTMPETEAAFKLAACCGSAKWVSEMIRWRPYHSRDRMMSAAEEVADTLENADWLDAFAHHPRIGEGKAAAPVSAQAEGWSNREQARVNRISGAVRSALVEGNFQYERKFGFIFIISAAGRDADTILSALLARVENSPEEEMAIAVQEQRKITRLRLEKLIEESEASA
ncbi:MAG: 2-oxo-4-hydroxy-4-carboxy-5-ureidoimidazoline decarboxylase [Gemmatimonadota bacterium]|nr:2-oxo-4-hydroxy-4-carboxy-5-ureidoimidazoline decarboxylase [Gemmatimonadota bacterium]